MGKDPVGINQVFFKLFKAELDAGFIFCEMVADFMPFLDHFLEDFFISRNPVGDQEEGGMCLVFLQQFDDLDGVGFIRPVINRQGHNLAVGVD